MERVMKETAGAADEDKRRRSGRWGGGVAATNSISTAQLMGLRAASLTAVSFSSVSVLDLLCSAVLPVPLLVRVTERLGGSAASGGVYVMRSYTPCNRSRRIRIIVQTLKKMRQDTYQ